ncbi:MAG: hypothetical protein RMM08_00430 [Armatimonadota bacterium]|nr:hypothetical protein [bacterium]MDW8319801.1 hypothetical protein [Armatimonadota bacterium]
MSRRIWLLLLIAPLLAGCGAGLKEEGRLPFSNPLGRSAGETMEMLVGTAPASRNGGAVTRQATANYTGSFANASSNVTIGNVRRFLICQRIQSAQVQVPEGAPLPSTITMNNFHLNATFSDNQAQVTFNVSVTGTVTLTRTTGNNYAVTVQGAGPDPCLGATVESGNLNTLAQIVTQGGNNIVQVTLRANVTSSPGLPDGSRILLTTGLGTGTLEL